MVIVDIQSKPWVNVDKPYKNMLKSLKWQDRFGGKRGFSSEGYGVTLPGRGMMRRFWLAMGRLLSVAIRLQPNVSIYRGRALIHEPM